MTAIRLRRRILLAGGAAALALAGCGSGGSIESRLSPARVIVFGDGFADLGETGRRFTVNDNTANVWTELVASSFGRPLTTASAGGLSYATGHARVTTKPDAVGNSATPTVEEQITRFLASHTIGPSDLLIVNAGTSDVIAESRRAITGAQSAAQAVENSRAAGRALGAQVRRLVNAGARHVLVVGPYNLSRSPWALRAGQAGLLGETSSRFNEDLLVSIVDLGDRVLYVDAALHYNLVTATPSVYGLNNAVDPVCTSVDPGAGIGAGPGQFSSAICTPSTLVPGVDGGRWLFADLVYPTPQGHRLFGEYAAARIRERW